jgi:MFS family permease
MNESVRRSAHPPGLYVLFFTELWERYSFYSMVSILVLYMNEKLGFDSVRAGSVYGWYTAGVYFLPLFGGLLADRSLGFIRSVLIGGALMMCGHLVLGVEQMPFFYTGLVLLAFFGLSDVAPAFIALGALFIGYLPGGSIMGMIQKLADWLRTPKVLLERFATAQHEVALNGSVNGAEAAANGNGDRPELMPSQFAERVLEEAREP